MARQGIEPGPFLTQPLQKRRRQVHSDWSFSFMPGTIIISSVSQNIINNFANYVCVLNDVFYNRLGIWQGVEDREGLH